MAFHTLVIRRRAWGWKVALPLVVLAVLSAATAGSALAAIGVTVGEAQLSANHSSTAIPVTVSCAPFDPTLTVFTTEVSITIEQVGARATGGLSAGFPSAMVFLCDGTSQTVTVTATPDPAAASLHPGPAIVSVFVRARAGIPCPSTPLCFGFIQTQDVTVTTQTQIDLETSGNGASEQVGARIGAFGGTAQTFPAGQPFHFSHGWVVTPQENAAAGLWQVSLTLDGVEIRPSFIDLVQIDDPVFGHLIHRLYVWNFPSGLTGTHVFGATFSGPCAELVASGQAQGPCPTPNAIVPATGFPVSTTVTFTA